MIHLKRGAAPDFWTWERVREWTSRWVEKGHRSEDWVWPTYKGQRINHYAREAMLPWHYDKCAFCETPLTGNIEIEHFRSKADHPRVAFVWYNLFLICSKCNSAKGGGSHKGCIKPDRDEPTDYLWFNPISRQVEPKPGISEEDQERARITIGRYDLNRPELRRLYEQYILNNVLPFLVRIKNLACQDREEGRQVEHERLPRTMAALKTLARPEQPFSLMVSNVLQYDHGV